MTTVCTVHPENMSEWNFPEITCLYCTRAVVGMVYR